MLGRRLPLDLRGGDLRNPKLTRNVLNKYRESGSHVLRKRDEKQNMNKIKMPLLKETTNEKLSRDPSFSLSFPFPLVIYRFPSVAGQDT